VCVSRDVRTVRAPPLPSRLTCVPRARAKCEMAALPEGPGTRDGSHTPDSEQPAGSPLRGPRARARPRGPGLGALGGCRCTSPWGCSSTRLRARGVGGRGGGRAALATQGLVLSVRTRGVARGAVRQQEGDGAVERHGVVQLVPNTSRLKRLRWTMGGQGCAPALPCPMPPPLAAAAPGAACCRTPEPPSEPSVACSACAEACSGTPYACVASGKDTSTPTDVGPCGLESWCVPKLSSQRSGSCASAEAAGEGTARCPQRQPRRHLKGRGGGAQG